MKYICAAHEEILAAVRRTPESPPRASVLDVLTAVRGLWSNTAWSRLRRRRPGLAARCPSHKFQGRCQKPTLVADASTLCDVALHVEWTASLQRKRVAAIAVVRHLSADESIVDAHLPEAMVYDTDSE